MAKPVAALLQLAGCGETSSDEDSEDEETSTGKKQPILRKNLRQRASEIGEGKKHALGLWLCGAAVVAVIVGVALWIPKLGGATEPTWEVTELVMEHIDIPTLGLKGMAPADTSGCPTADLCGVGLARGCSKCPVASMWNNGCLCQERDPGSNATAQPGSVIQADTSACPDYDRCGVLAARGCSACPDDTWTNDGCTCRQAISPSQFFNSLSTVARSVGGGMASMLGIGQKQPTTVKMALRAAVEVFNPNPIGAQVDPGVFKIRYRGEEIGAADTLPTTVPARGSTQFSVQVDVDNVPPNVGMMMLQEMLQSGSQLRLVVDGRTTASVNVLKVKCSAECHLRTDLSQLPKVRFTENKCSYGYSV